MDKPPVILIGAARSGTKFLRDALATDEALSKVPYDVNYVWRTGQLGKSDDVLEPGFINERKAQKIRATLRKLALIGDGDATCMIEKSVSNTLRVPFVECIYPGARYIHLVRNGHAVIESSMRMWKEPPDTGNILRKLRDLPLNQYGYVAWFAANYAKGLLKGRSGGEVWGPRYPGILEDVKRDTLLQVVARQWAWCVRKAADDLDRLPPDQVLTIRYEDLTSNSEAVARLVDFAGVSDRPGMAAAISDGFDPANLYKWCDRLTAEDMAVIDSEAGEVLRRFGYLE